MASTITPLIYSAVVSATEDNLPYGYLNLTLASVVISFFPLITSMYMYFGPFGVLDMKFKEVEDLKKGGMPLNEIIAKYGDL